LRSQGQAVGHAPGAPTIPLAGKVAGHAPDDDEPLVVLRRTPLHRGHDVEQLSHHRRHAGKVPGTKLAAQDPGQSTHRSWRLRLIR
jgi:hypothetical protein